MAAAGAWKIPPGYRQGMTVPLDQRPRVRLATKAIQRRLIDVSLLDADPVTLNGGWGPKTTLAVRDFQHGEGLFVDGVCGRITAKALWTPLYGWHETALDIPQHLLMGQGFLESAFDPGAEGDNPRGPEWFDRGIHQLSRHWHPEITDDQAYDAAWSIAWSANTLRTTFDSLHEWRWAIAAHNDPDEAERLAQGRPGRTEESRVSILRYIDLVFHAALQM